jgi:hypothetical protein
MLTFSSFIVEMPQLNNDITKSVNARAINPIKAQLKNEKHKE